MRPSLPRGATLAPALLLALGLACTTSALAQTPAAAAASAASAPDKAPLRLGRVGVFSLLGGSLHLARPAETVSAIASPASGRPAGRAGRGNRSEILALKDPGLDQVALKAVLDSLAALQPQASLSMFRASESLSVAEQRAVADGAYRSELPDWIVRQVQAQALQQVLLVSLDRGEAAFATPAGENLGQGLVDGIGFYVESDNAAVDTEGRSRAADLSDSAFIAPFVQLRLTLMDVASAKVLTSIGISDGTVHFARNREQAAQPWTILDGTQKLQALRSLVQVNVGRALPLLLER